MTDIMQGLVQEAKKNKFSSISTTLSDDDVVSIWDNVSLFIEKHMTQQKGVSIPGLGTFTFSQKKLDVGNNKHLLIQRPVFLLTEKFAQTHGVHCTKHHVSGQIPVVQLNYAALSFESPFDRDTVEACVKEVLQALSRSVASKRNVEFTFQGIGRLHIRDSKVKMKFYKEFVHTMDGSGQLINALKDRPGTVDSVMSATSPVRPSTSNTIILPRRTSAEKDKPGITPEGNLVLEPRVTHRSTEAMPAIIEEDQVERDIPVDEEPQAQADYLENEETFKDIPCEPEEGRGSPVLDLGPGRTGSRATVQLAKATGVSFGDDLMPPTLPSPKGIRAGSTLSQKSSPALMLQRRSLSPISSPHLSPPIPEELNFRRSKTADSLILRRPQKPGTPLHKIGTPPLKLPSPPNSACGHPNAGQELCYLCHQRDRRNVPVDFTEERKRREEEQDRLLQQYQQMTDQEAAVNEQEQLLARRHENQKMAAFNLGAADAVNAQKNERPTDFHPSFVFQRRPLTPPRYIKQNEYYDDLADQVKTKDEADRKTRSDDEFLERLEQVQLAEDLAAQRDQYLKDKAKQQEQYKRALSAQIVIHKTLSSPSETGSLRATREFSPLSLPRPKVILPFSETLVMRLPQGKEGFGTIKQLLKYKPLPIPGRVPDSSEPVFGRNDMNSEKMVQKRRRAYDLYKEQLETVELKRREAILKRLQEQKNEEDILKKSKQELLEDRSNRYLRLFTNRKRIEDDWAKAADLKRNLESDERVCARSPGMLLHEQCDRYKRCCQCKRNLVNCGESNIWRESRYIPGSRLMV